MGTALGDFIRARRDATSPESVGVGSRGQRRAPGLRRSELATLAGISVEYLVRIEQGRDRRPSAQVVNAIAEALRLDPEERRRLKLVATATSGECPYPVPTGNRTAIRPPVRAILEQLEPAPAVVKNRLGDLLAYTSGYEALVRPLGLLDDPQPNLTRFVFTHPNARQAFPAWDRVADMKAAELWLGKPADRVAALIEELSELAGGEFTSRLNGQCLPGPGTQRWRHPVAGEVTLSVEELELPADDAQQLLILLPADAATARALDRLQRDGTDDAGALRVVQ